MRCHLGSGDSSMHWSHTFNSTRMLVHIFCPPVFISFHFLFLLSSFFFAHIFIGILIPLCFPLCASTPLCIATCILPCTGFIFIIIIFYIVDVPQVWQHAQLCTLQGLRARSPTQQSDGLPDRRSSDVRAPTSPPTHPPIPTTMHLLHPLQSP